jgi:hypothetical protein
MMAALPWQVFKSPLEQWSVLPSFLVGEYLFILCAVVALVHALKQPGAERRRHLSVWIGALVAGTVNDWIFMLLPLVENFWQAQATIMISARMPLYIPCVYVWFMYLPTVAIWRIDTSAGRWGRWGRAAASGLAAIVVYAPYDIIGAKFLWWTWHDTDQPIARRLLGVPLGSTIWVICFVASFAWLMNRMLERDDDAPWSVCAAAVGATAALSTLLMMIQMTVLQQIDGGTPGPIGLAVIVVIYGALALRAFHGRGRTARPRAFDRTLRGVVWSYFAVLFVLLVAFDPQTHRSTGLHQAVGECYVEAKDITGLTRYEFLCVDDFDEDYGFDCVEAEPTEGARWYTICGRPHRAKGRWIAGVGLWSVVGLSLFGWLLSGPATSRLRERADGDSG